MRWPAIPYTDGDDYKLLGLRPSYSQHRSSREFLASGTSATKGECQRGFLQQTSPKYKKDFHLQNLSKTAK